MVGRETFEQGMGWRIGSGSTVDIWQHKWRPDTDPWCPLSAPTDHAPRWVSELIDPVMYEWDTKKLEALFCPADFELILSISLNRRLVEDRLVWHFHRQGTFTTNSAYFVANDISLGNVLAPHPPIDIYGRL